MSTEVREALVYLPPHDQRTYSAAVKTLSEKLQVIRSVHEPKREFTFKRSSPAKEQPSTSRATQPSNTPTNRDVVPETPNNDPDNIATAERASLASNTKVLTISPLKCTTYILDEATLKSSALISDLGNCFIDLSISIKTARPFSTLTIKNISKSLLFCGRVSGAAHITSITGSTLIIRSQQVRMHECHDCVVYLFCNSRPIIENCDGIRFAPLPESVMSLPADSSAISSVNQWNRVNDFNWLKSKQSPHWSVLQPEDERAISDQGWEKIIAPESSQLELDELLKAGRIPT